MKKEQKKEFELQIINSIEKLLSTHDAKAAEKVKRHIKDAGKTVAKKFYKAAKLNAEEVAKMAAKAAVKTPVKKAAVAVTAVTAKANSPKKAAASKKVRPARKKSK